MKWRLSPKLTEPDYLAWWRRFPRGIGPSIYSSPAWQRLMHRELGSGWYQRTLHGNDGEKKVCLPVFVRKNRWQRYDLAVHPVAYYVTPIDHDEVDAAAVNATLAAAASMRTSTFAWWLPPWCTWSPEMLDEGRFDGCVTHSNIETYVIALNQPFEEYMARSVHKQQTSRANKSIKRGLFVVDNPSPQLIDEYYALYLRVHAEQRWIDKPFSRPFFHGAATALEDGGQLLVMKYNDQVVGGGLLLYDTHAVHYFQGITDRTQKLVFSHSVLYAEALKRAWSRGLKYVNLGGVNPGNDGLIRFKLAWGAKEVPVYLLQWRCTMKHALKSAFRSA